MFLNFRDGINFKMIMSRDMAWPALSLVASALTIAGAFKDDSTGIIAWIGEIGCSQSLRVEVLFYL